MTSLAATLNHPQRLQLAAEIHSRPFLFVSAPARISHLAIHFGHRDGSHDDLLASLCQRFSVAPPAVGAQHFAHDFGHFRLKWERHAEFSTFTFVEVGDDRIDFEITAIRHIPHDWLALLEASVLVALHIHTVRGQPMDIADPSLRQTFPAPPLVGSRVMSDGEVWTDFQVGPTGFSKYLIRDVGLRETQMGRLVQRICEIETYLVMALLALPLARSSTPLLNETEESLIKLGNRMKADKDGTDAEALLHEISSLDARLRDLSFRNSYRFSAAQAYYRIVVARIGELREQRIEGVPTIGEFMERRLAPAMDTCVSVAARQERLAGKVSRSNDMLRTRVNLAQERQTHHVLGNLNQSARLQLKMQQAVEGLSVVAISYYGIGLAGYALKALKAWGIDIAIDQSLGVVLPLVCLATWLGTRRIHERLHQPERSRGRGSSG